MLKEHGLGTQADFLNTITASPVDQGILNPLDTAKLNSPASITEHTTKLLSNQNQAPE
jgi:hypothetical protein